jgi:hypothetical protein
MATKQDDEFTDPQTGATIRKQGDKLIITIPNPKNKSPQEVGTMAGHDCSSRCAGLISNASAFVF